VDRDIRRQLARQLGPFAVTTLAAWGAVLVGAHTDWAQYAVSVGLLALSWSYGLSRGLRGHMRSGTVIGSLGFLAALALARNAVGGSTAGISIVSLLPVFQTALYVRDRRALWIVLAAVLAFYLTPLVLVGPPEYPTSGYRSALLAVAVSSIVGLVTHGLVADIRRRARAARHNERMLVRINETVQGLFESPNPRRDACGAVKEISDAIVAGLFEPEPGSQTLRLSASTAEREAAGTPAAAQSAVHEAFHSRQTILITENAETYVGDVELWRASGAPASVLYQPLLKGDVAVGVLFVGWSGRVQEDGPGVVAASLLAHEIASVIDRADMIGQLTDEALTDALTGLPNRRAWDAELARAMQGRVPVAVAMLDIDHFKRFNDTQGHPAGDRLLREAASRWRSEMRAGDFLARLGGEEFALLVTGADVTTIAAIVARLCAGMPAQQTCSAGIALRSIGDAPEQLVARADAALYEAKTGGRNRVVFTDADRPGASA
jgi:diguanylate cyclase (GGDEF)-like protein